MVQPKGYNYNLNNKDILGAFITYRQVSSRTKRLFFFKVRTDGLGRLDHSTKFKHSALASQVKDKLYDLMKSEETICDDFLEQVPCKSNIFSEKIF